MAVLRPELLKGHLDLLLLAALKDGPAHGYAVIIEVRSRSRGTFDLAEGTVYPALHRLERSGLLESWWLDHEGRRRRVYRLTANGASALAEQHSAYRQFEKGMRWGLGSA